MDSPHKKGWQKIIYLFTVKNLLKRVKEFILKMRLGRKVNSKRKILAKEDNSFLTYFNLLEFDSPDEVGSGFKMDKEFLIKLDTSRGVAGIPFKINSGYRTEKHNLKVGGRVGSSHLKGLAADIGYYGSRERYLILNSLIQAGINRIGIAKSFIHCDLDNLKDKDVIWLY